MINTKPLSSKAVLAAVRISGWSARKYDRNITAKVNADMGSAGDAGRWNKLLVEKECLAEIGSIESRARTFHYSLTLPWADDGPRILPNAFYDKFCDGFRALKREHSDAADKFAAAYPEFIEARKAKLNGAFNPADYPTPEKIRSKFSLEVTMLPFPEVADFRADLDPQTIADLRADFEVHTQNALAAATAQTYEQIAKVVGKMVERLKGYEKTEEGTKNIFRDSLVGNVRELVKLLPHFNLANDPTLATITERIDRELCADEAKTLRQDEATRVSVTQSAEDILATVGKLLA